MLIQPFQAIFPDFGLIEDKNHFSETVRENYVLFKNQGIFKTLEETAIFIYQIRTPQQKYVGLVALSDIHAYLEGNILKHENTIVEKEKNQIELTKSRNAIVKPILLTYPSKKSIKAFIQTMMDKTPIFYEISLDNEQQKHTFWKISAPKNIQKIQTLFNNHLPKSYIADGHHRLSILKSLYEQFPKENNPYQYFLSAYFASDELDVLEFNRIVSGLNGLSEKDFLAKIEKIAQIKTLKKATKPQQKAELTLCINEKWYQLNWKKKVYKAYNQKSKTLDSQLLNDLILKDILGIQDVRNSTNIASFEGFRSLSTLESKAKEKPNSIIFCLYPIPIQQVFNMADQSLSLPPKSTCFLPRMKNGLFVQEF